MEPREPRTSDAKALLILGQAPSLWHLTFLRISKTNLVSAHSADGTPQSIPEVQRNSVLSKLDIRCKRQPALRPSAVQRSNSCAIMLADLALRP
jgi:hypothetical protein